MSKLVRTEMVMVDKALAQIILTTNNFPRQRRLRPVHLARLIAAIQRGRLKSGTIEICRFNGLDYLMDGQHRCRAIVEADGCVKMNIAYYEASTENELNEHYMMTDNGLRRSVEDNLRASNFAEEYGLDVKYAKYFAAAAAFLIEALPRTENTVNVPMDDGRIRVIGIEYRLEKMKEMLTEGQDYLDYFHNAPFFLKKSLRTAPVFAAGLLTLREVPGKSGEFWKNVSRNSGLHVGAPEHTLVRTLTDNQQSTGQRRLDPWTFRAVITAWNAFEEGREVAFLKPDLSSPLFIAGSEMYKRQRNRG